jgi:choloylglycine hydrolase
MCTAVSLSGAPHLFGRTLDLEDSCGAGIVITPRAFRFATSRFPDIPQPVAMIGVARLQDDQPLYFDAVNEHGLAIAALHFAGNAVYLPPRADAYNVPSYALIPWLLRQSRTVSEARSLLLRTNVTAAAFCDALPPSPLHWLLADDKESLVIEPTAAGLQLYDNPVGILTNNPPFPCQLTRLQDYAHLTATASANAYSKGLGAVGLPGDFSSPSRLSRAAFVKKHLSKVDHATAHITRFFHLMDAVTVPVGCVQNAEGAPFFTQYTSCADTQSGTYYFTTHQNRRIRAVPLTDAAKNATAPIRFSMDGGEDIDVLTPCNEKSK